MVFSVSSVFFESFFRFAHSQHRDAPMLDPECASPQAAPAAPQHPPAELEGEVAGRRRPQGKQGKKRSGAPRPKVKKAEPEGEVAGRRRPQGKKRSGVPRPKVKKHKASADSVYTCSHEGCNYTCSRKDLLIKHESTHVAKLFACNMSADASCISR